MITIHKSRRDLVKSLHIWRDLAIIFGIGFVFSALIIYNNGGV